MARETAEESCRGRQPVSGTFKHFVTGSDDRVLDGAGLNVDANCSLFLVNPLSATFEAERGSISKHSDCPTVRKAVWY